MSEDIPFRGFCNRLLDCLAQLCCCADTTPAISTQPRSSTASTAPLTVPPRRSAPGSRQDVESGRGFVPPARAQHVDSQNRSASTRGVDTGPTVYPFIKFVPSTEQTLQPKGKKVTTLPEVHRKKIPSGSATPRQNRSADVRGASAYQSFINFVPTAGPALHPKAKKVTTLPEVDRKRTPSKGAATSRQDHFLPQLPKFETAIDTVDETDWTTSTFDQPASSYREQAFLYRNRCTQFFDKARQCRLAKNRALADYYVNQAIKQKKLSDQAHSLAAAAFLEENNKKHRDDTIDLHYLYVKEALPALDIFLDDKISSLRDESSETKSLSVITGRGKHTADGVPRLKLAVMERLKERGLKFSAINPGCLKVKILVHSYLSNELPEV